MTPIHKSSTVSAALLVATMAGAAAAQDLEGEASSALPPSRVEVEKDGAPSRDLAEVLAEVKARIAALDHDRTRVEPFRRQNELGRLEADLRACERTLAERENDPVDLAAAEAMSLIDQTATRRLAALEAERAELRRALTERDAALEAIAARADRIEELVRARKSESGVALARAQARVAAFASEEEKARLARLWIDELGIEPVDGGWRVRLDRRALFGSEPNASRLATSALEPLSKLAALIVRGRALAPDRPARLIGREEGRTELEAVRAGLIEHLGVPAGALEIAVDPTAEADALLVDLPGVSAS